MIGDNNNILANLTPATIEMLSGLGEQQLSTILMCEFIHLFPTFFLISFFICIFTSYQCVIIPFD